MDFADGRAGLGGAEGRLLRGQHDVVNLRLRRAELARSREGARHVGRVVVVLGAGVDEDQVVGVDRPLRLLIVERRRVRAAADDIRVAPVVGVAAFVGVVDFGLDLVLPLRARSHGLRPSVPFDADVDGVREQEQSIGESSSAARRRGPRRPNVKPRRGLRRWPRTLLHAGTARVRSRGREGERASFWFIASKSNLRPAGPALSGGGGRGDRMPGGASRLERGMVRRRTICAGALPLRASRSAAPAAGPSAGLRHGGGSRAATAVAAPYGDTGGRVNGEVARRVRSVACTARTPSASQISAMRKFCGSSRCTCGPSRSRRPGCARRKDFARAGVAGTMTSSRRPVAGRQ